MFIVLALPVVFVAIVLATLSTWTPNVSPAQIAIALSAPAVPLVLALLTIRTWLIKRRKFKDSQTKPMRCIKCGYRLHGLEGTTCPECAREFDPADSKTYMPEDKLPFPWFWVRQFALWLPVAFVLISFVLALVNALLTGGSFSLRTLPSLVVVLILELALVPTVIIILWWLIKRRKFKD